MGDAVRRHRSGRGSGRRRPDQRAGRGRRHAPERPGPPVPGGRRDRAVLPHGDRARQSEPDARRHGRRHPRSRRRHARPAARFGAGRTHRRRRRRRGRRPRGHRRLDDRRERPLPRCRAIDDVGRVARGDLRLARRNRDGIAVDDVVPRRRVDRARLRPVLPAAEPAGDHRPRHGQLPAAVRHDDHADLHPRAGQPDDDLREPGGGPRRDRRVRRRQRRRADRRGAGHVPQPARPALRARAPTRWACRRRRRRGSWPRARPARSSISTC